MNANQTTETDAASTDSDSDTGDETGTESTLAWGTTAFEPGGDVALVARQTVGLIERDNPSTRERLWGLVSDDAPLDDILDELSSTGLKALPDFGLAQVEGSAIRIVARGRTTISAELSSGSTHEIDPSGVRTWIEELVEDVASITITLPVLDDAPPSGEKFAVLAGSVPASSLTRRYDAPDDHAADAESGAGWTAGGTETSSTSATSDDDEIASVSEVELDLVDDIHEPGSAAGDSSLDDQASDPSASPLDITADPVPTDSASAAPVPANPQPASPQPPPPGSSPAGPPPSSPRAGGTPPSAAPPDSTVVAGPDDGPTPGPGSSVFDDDFDDHAAGSVTGAAPGDHDGMTAGRAVSEDQPADDDAPTGAPVHGVLAFSNGERVQVDRAVLIGRNPKVAEAVEGGLPHIMKFDGPGQGLSRTHAEIRLVDGEVLIEDLQSTNGTEVQLPGQQRRRLRSGEPVVIVPGTLIDFGEELHCTLESSS
ncbi:MAG: FHA domain-containing protein [Ilumatobacter sp.]|uniref:FHA domain-containing protein n=1 Tax=Ilumatobacter sp. TaxID=1967498 RepID=UPI003C760CA0